MANRRGFKWNAANSRLDVRVDGSLAAYIDNATPYLVVVLGMTVPAGNLINTAGDKRITAGNCRLGAVSAFANTEPTSALVFKVGTAPAGAVATSGGLFTDGTNVMKIIADGTADAVET